MNKLGENITRFRKRKGLSQEKLAEYMDVSRQAVTKWENGNSRPSTDNLIKLAELFEVKVEELLLSEQENSLNEKKVIDDNLREKFLEEKIEFEGNAGSKSLEENNYTAQYKLKKEKNNILALISTLFFILSLICILVYIVYGKKHGLLYSGTLMCVCVMAVIQLGLNFILSRAVAKENFTMIAGFSNKIEYNKNEVKVLLTNINNYIGMVSSFYIFLICTCVCFNIEAVKGIDVVGILLFCYIVDFIGMIMISNYRSMDNLYLNEKDKIIAKLGFPATVIYIIIILVEMAYFMLVVHIKEIENNTAPAIKAAGLLIISIIILTAGYFIESGKIKKSDLTNEHYKLSKSYMGCILVSIMFLIFVLLV